MWILLWILFGAVVGWVASLLTGNNKRMGAVKNIIVGLLGSLIGGWISTLIGMGSYAKFSLSSFMIALLGAVVLLFVVNQFTIRKR